MEAQYPNNLYDFYENHSEFEKRNNQPKRIMYIVLIALCVLLIIYPSLIPLGNLLVRIIAIIGLLYCFFSFYTEGSSWYNKTSNGEVKLVSIKKFAYPESGDDFNGEDAKRIKELFNQNDWEGLLNEGAADNRPLQLYIHEDATGKTFYLQLMQFFSSSDFRGVSEVKVISGKEYSDYYQIIKKI